MCSSDLDGGPQNPLTIALNGASGSLEGAGTGFITKTSGSNVVSRTFTAVGGGISIANGDGIAGNPQISAAGVLADIVGLSGTGILALNNTSAVTMLQIQGTANLSDIRSAVELNGYVTCRCADGFVDCGTHLVDAN